TFEYICAEPALSFFFMDLHLLEPSGVYDDICGDTEELAEINGQYFVRDLRYGNIERYDDAGRLISTRCHARPVKRLLRGHLLFVDRKSTFWQGLGYGYFWNSTSASELRDLVTAMVNPG
ncbi:hypothetical protein, partial [Ensifer sp. SSB1]|uniref:hypothetical protein n=1 Tax=Ensifer sp. SSB1 TaxID=2795385 RepID=UPI001A399B66